MSDRMKAAENDPWVSVSLLGECLFCNRAGRFHHEQSQEDTGEESDIEPPRRGWYRRPFTVVEIERELAKWKPRMGFGFAAAAVAFVVAYFTGAPEVSGLVPGMLVLAGVLSAVMAFR